MTYRRAIRPPYSSRRRRQCGSKAQPRAERIGVIRDLDHRPGTGNTDDRPATDAEYLRGADPEASRGGGTGTDRGGRDTATPGPSGEPAKTPGAGQGSADNAEAGDESERKTHGQATDPGPTS